MDRPPTRAALVASLGLLAAACGTAPAPEPIAPAPAEPEPPAVDAEDGIRLGCDRIPQAAIDAEARRRTTTDDRPLDEASQLAIRDEAGTALARRAILKREARRLRIEVTDDDVDRAIAGLMASRGLDATALAAALDEQGLDMPEYRAELAVQLLEFKVLSAVAFPRVTEAEVRAEYDRSAAEVDPGSRRSYDEARDDIRARRTEARAVENLERHVERTRRFLEAVETEGEGEACVERWPELAPSEFRFEGNAALSGDDLRSCVVQAAGVPETVRVEGSLPETVRALLLAAYADRGYVEASFEVEELTAEQVVVGVHEGPAYRLGRVRVVVRGADGTESEPPGGEAAWRPLLDLAEGDVFSRIAIGGLLEALPETLARAWEIETTAVMADVETETHDGTIDVTVVVRRP